VGSFLCYNKPMGIFNILFGGSSKPRVTEKEYRKAKSELAGEGFSKYQRAKVDDIFAPDFEMAGTYTHPRGLEKAEIEARIKWMRENKSKHGLSDEKINEIEASLNKRL
jgi:hypothetical protein